MPSLLHPFAAITTCRGQSVESNIGCPDWNHSSCCESFEDQSKDLSNKELKDLMDLADRLYTLQHSALSSTTQYSWLEPQGTKAMCKIYSHKSAGISCGEGTPALDRWLCLPVPWLGWTVINKAECSCRISTIQLRSSAFTKNPQKAVSPTHSTHIGQRYACCNQKNVSRACPCKDGSACSAMPIRTIRMTWLTRCIQKQIEAPNSCLVPAGQQCFHHGCCRVILLCMTPFSDGVFVQSKGTCQRQLNDLMMLQ